MLYMCVMNIMNVLRTSMNMCISRIHVWVGNIGSNSVSLWRFSFLSHACVILCAKSFDCHLFFFPFLFPSFVALA